MTDSLLLNTVLIAMGLGIAARLAPMVLRIAWRALVLLTPFGIVAFFHLCGEVIRAVRKARQDEATQQDDNAVT